MSASLLATAQGWKLVEDCGEPVRWIQVPVVGSIPFREYNPLTNLTQALAAARAMNATVELRVDGSGYRLFFGRHFPREARAGSEACAAGEIAAYLLDSLEDAA